MRISDFELQTQSGQLWLDIVERLAAKDEAQAAQLAAKDAEIAKLQPGYVAPEPPTVDQRIEEAIAAALTPDEQLTYAKEIVDAKAHFCAVAVEESKPVEEKPIDIDPVEIAKP